MTRALTALALAGCVAEAAPRRAAARFEDPTVPAGPAYAGCAGEERGPDGAVRSRSVYDEDGQRIRYDHRFVEGVPTRVETATFADGRPTGRALAVRSAPDAELEEVLAVEIRWDGDRPVEERGSDGAVVTATWDAEGRRLAETRVAEGAAPVSTRWTWEETAAGGERATVAWAGWAPTSFTWDAEGRLVERTVGGSATTFTWAGDTLVAWETDGWSVTRAHAGGRLVREAVNGAPAAETTWTCPAEGWADAAE